MLTVIKEYSARVLARDNDGNIYLPLGYVEIGPWASEMRWVENPLDQMWFSNESSRDYVVEEVNIEYSKYQIVPDSIENMSRITTIEIITTPK